MALDATNYPAFVPPDALAVTPPMAWRAVDADRYLAWFVRQVDLRTDRLLSSLGESFDPDMVEHILLRVGNEVRACIGLGGFLRQDKNGRSVLTNAGYALGADIGLLVARSVVAKVGRVATWQVLRRPRSALSFNLPVLQGCGLPLDPIAAGIAIVYRINDGTSDATALVKAFHQLSAKPSTADRSVN
jgi:hypothetical protein